MSGLGDRKRLMLKEVDTRYTYLTELAHSHATLSMGICCYTLQKSSGMFLYILCLVLFFCFSSYFIYKV